MPVRALTIDFWNTMVVARTGGAAREQQRFAHLAQAMHRCGGPSDEPRLRTAYRAAVDRFNATWERDHQTPATAELVRCIWDALALEIDEALHAETVTVFEEGLLHGPPDLADGLAEALAWAADRYRLGVISDTMFSPGRVIRRLLDERGLLRYFDVCIFSDETGFSKPDPRAFHQAAAALGVAPDELAHVGDLRRTDVAGARGVQATALLYTGVHDDDGPGPDPDAVLAHWRALPDALAAPA